MSSMKRCILFAVITGAFGAKIKFERHEDHQTPTCVPGFALNQSTGKCSDIDECATNKSTCHVANKCRNTEGSFLCECATGYSGTLPLCVDIDECTTGKHTCHNKAKGVICKNNLGSFDCACGPGWTGLNYTGGEGLARCVNRNECTLNNHSCHSGATCRDTEGSFQCMCNDGYQGNGTHCDDKNECTAGACSQFQGSVCHNTVGSYTCNCTGGWNQTGTTSCGSVNECANSSLNNCMAGKAQCFDTIGSFWCKCNAGYLGNGVNCTDENECVTKTVNACPMSPLAGSLCNNTDGSFECKCKTGWNQTAVDQPCRNINECAANSTLCGTSADCKDSQGSFVCVCKTGYRYNTSTQLCDDIDECKAPGANRLCPGVGLTCWNTNGSFACPCGPGYTALNATASSPYKNASNHSCKDRNECTENTHQCHTSLGQCYNTHGSYACSCKKGYVGDGISCMEIDECTLGKNKCHSAAACADTNGSYTCTCNTGWTGNGTTCTDLNECAAAPAGAPNYANTGKVAGVNTCDSGATCTNTAGSFLCSCRAGGSGDGLNTTQGGLGCTDINECDLGLHNCPVNSDCVDTAGSFTCNCTAGYRLTFNYAGINMSDAAAKARAPHWCGEIDECGSTLANGTFNKSDVCHSLANCTNTVGSYLCKCSVGYTGTGKNCTDLDECKTAFHNCDSNAFCTNTVGSFTCGCKPGFNGTGIKSTGASATLGCYDINECDVQAMNRTICINESTCANTHGSFRCSCKPGYSGDGSVCSNLDECAMQTDNCHAMATCTDTVGSFFCNCTTGYKDFGATVTNGTPGVICVSEKTIEVGMKQLSIVGWQIVKFQSAFAKAPVVVLDYPLMNGMERETYLRIRKVTTTGFEVAMSFASGWKHSAEDDAVFYKWLISNSPVISYIAVVPGKNALPDGTVIRAGHVQTKHAGQRSHACTKSKWNYWQKVTYQTNFTNNPVVLTHIEGMADAKWSGGLIKNFCRAQARQSNLSADEHAQVSHSWFGRVCQRPYVLSKKEYKEEKLGWIAISANSSNFTFPTVDGSKTITFTARSGPYTLSGLEPEQNVALDPTFPSAPIAMVDKVSSGPFSYGYMKFEGGMTDKLLFKTKDFNNTPTCSEDLMGSESVQDLITMFVASEAFSV